MNSADSVGRIPPTTLALRPATIPAALRDLPQWVAWRWEWRAGTATKPGKWTKVPVNVATGGHARSNAPATWATFTVALAYAQAHTGTIAGIGFVFSDGDNFAGIDLDKCRDADTGVIDAWAMSVITALASYTEASPSGTGVKVFTRATLPGGGIHCPRPNGIPGGTVEIYDRGRFFTVTGHHVPATPAAIRDAQTPVDTLYARLRGESGTKGGIHLPLPFAHLTRPYHLRTVICSAKLVPPFTAQRSPPCGMVGAKMRVRAISPCAVHSPSG